MKQVPDQLIRDVIVRDLHLNMLVEASAGTGKTESLCRRIAASLLNGAAEPERMAAITFTRKAAAELRGRLRLVLEREIREAPDPELKQRGLSVLDRLEDVFIGTIHSFCSRLLREHPIEAGVVPGFAEMEQAEYRELLFESLGQTLHEARGDDPTLFRDILSSEIRLRQLLPGLEVMCAQPDVAFEVPEVGLPEVTTVVERLQSFIARLEELLPDPIPEMTTCDIQRRYRRLRYLFSLVDPEEPVTVVGCLELWRTGLKPVQKWWPGDRAARKAASEQARTLVDQFVEEVGSNYLRLWRGYLYGRVVKLFRKARRHFEMERERSARLDFVDLLRLAAKLLRENLSVRKSLQCKYKTLFVDEFQDTDPLQTEVVFLLASRSDYQGTRWREAPLRPGSLFVVGDPKQSIYRFRRADIELFQTVKERIEASGGVSLTLSTSFRSTSAICSWGNRVFSQLLPPSADERQAGFSPLEAMKGESRGPLSGVFALSTEGKNARMVSQEEAEIVAHRISEAVSSGEYRYGDFLVLTAKRSELSHYYHALTTLGVPSEVTGGVPDDRPLTTLFLQLLRVLTTPDDAVGIVGLLRSSLYGLSDRLLYQHRTAGGRFRLTPNQEGEELVIGALDDLATMQQWTRSLSVAAAAEKILDHTGLLALAYSQGDWGASSLLQTVHTLRTLSSRGMPMGHALDALELCEPEFPVSLATGQKDVVRVMNLHQAKGLQARVVFLAAPTAGLSEKVALRVEKDGGEARGHFSLRDGRRVIAEPLDWPTHENAEQEFLLAERVRLLYVAATRAEEGLVVSRWLGKDGRVSEPWAPLYDFLDGCECLDTSVPAERRESVGETLSLDEADSARLERVARWSECAEPSWTRTSVTALASEGSTTTASFAGPAEQVEEYGAEGGAAWGDLIHRLLERLAADPSLTDDDLLALGRWYIHDTPELAEFLARAVDTVRAVTRDDLWRKVLSSGRRLMEVPFGVSREQGKRLVFGVVDLAVESADGSWELVDYKTDRRSARKLLERYAGQLEQYVEHWQALTGAPAGGELYRVRLEEGSRAFNIVDKGVEECD